MKRFWILTFKTAVAVALLAYLLLEQKIPLGDLGALGSHWPWFLAAQGLYGLILLLAAWRWRILLRTQDLECSLGEAWKLTLIGHFFNQFMLGSTGGDLVKAYYIATNHPERKAPAILTVFLDRAVGLVVLLSVAAVAALLNIGLLAETPWLASLAIFVAALLLGCLLAAGLFYAERVRSIRLLQRILSRLPFQQTLAALSGAVYVYKFHPRRVLSALAVSLALHLSVITVNALFCLSLGLDLPRIRALVLLIPLAQIIMAVPVSPGSWGTSEVAYQKLLHLCGLTVGALVAILQRLTYYLWALYGCIVYLSRRRRIGRVPPAEAWIPPPRREEPPGDAQRGGLS
ncbi:MAG: flippase-like domain-containing protein [Planctomycetes bacterium]|nr:flippase-like domain-containing protein [Planctomycetota bacterium]